MSFKKVIVYYFSGTGNARHCAELIGIEAQKVNLPVEIRNIAEIDRKNIPVPQPGYLIGFCSPTHGFNFPDIMRNFIHNFPKVHKGISSRLEWNFTLLVISYFESQRIQDNRSVSG